jgi:uncharacterized protein
MRCSPSSRSLGFALPFSDHSALLKEFVTTSLCLECGLCCNGVIFGDVKLQPADSAAHLRSLGLSIKSNAFKQPCAAWQNCRCAIYSDRPTHCSKFECLLLKDVAAKALAPAEALKIIRRAQKQVSKTRELLKQFGQNENDCDLRSQFRRMTRLVDSRKLSRKEAGTYSRLTLEFHALDRLLRKSFYRE